MISKFNKEYPGKVRIVGISIESKKDVVKKAVESKEWTDVEHYIFIREKFENKRHPCETSYNFNVIPYVVLIDKSGKVVF